MKNLQRIPHYAKTKQKKEERHIDNLSYEEKEACRTVLHIH
ncbi:Hypothetical protein ACI5QL_00050 [Bacillus velezensis]|nr:hypothetical protein U471_00440 [Bacillus amyloliquefaciens CC178]KYC90742.1 hypothetical protein B4140_0065 [Bacillus amyloliquefaciens]RAP05675.1 hypothetical protein HS9_01619 [Bacillus velezensis]RAP13724.1 hypothetical protein C2W63_01061 [Bacillus velezensis]RUR92746.1 hypothetical protein EFW57_01270 [Bacillus velezensis]